MQEIYLSVDVEREEFNISQAVFKSPMPKADLVTILPKDNVGDLRLVPGSGGKGLETGAIVGIAVGVVVLILMAGGVWWWVWRRRRRGREEGMRVYANGDTTEGPPMDEKNYMNELESNNTGGLPTGSKVSHDNKQTDLELDGGIVNEMYAPGHTVTELYAPHKGEMTYGGRIRQVNTEVVEAEGLSPIFELPCHHGIPQQRQI
jgi:hypothetical protein